MYNQIHNTFMEATISLDINEVKQHLLSNKFIIPTAQSYHSIETSSKGFHTYGPLGLKLKNRIINLWRDLLVTSDVHEIDTPILQSKEVLTNSGHIGKFNDLIINNGKEIFRADHLVKDFCEKSNIKLARPIDDYVKEELLELVKTHKMVENSENATISPKSLMFSCGDVYLRPEIAQGMFTEFDQFYTEYKLPFGLAQVGKSYRNEISPQPFIRLREFTQAEVEYFFDPLKPESHHLFNTVKNLTIPILSQSEQLNGVEQTDQMTIFEAVNNNIIVNEIMGYFLGKIYMFMKELGLDDNVVRFRQHLPNELAHYARQCWDLEIKLINGHWLECVGCAHRGDYDLKNHNIKNQNVIKEHSTKLTKFKISLGNNPSKELLKEFNIIYKTKVFNSKEEILFDTNYYKFKDNILITTVSENIDSVVIPHVIEPSMGIDRIIFGMANNLLKKRQSDHNKILFKLPIKFVPYQLAIYAISNKGVFEDYVKNDLLFLNNIFSIYYDFSGTSIGKRYVRSDEIGIQLTITVDPQTLQDDTVTIRHSSDGHQDRIHKNDLINVINNIFSF